jgi:hypothetical protein
MTTDKTDWLAVGVVLGEVSIFWSFLSGLAYNQQILQLITAVMNGFLAKSLSPCMRDNK